MRAFSTLLVCASLALMPAAASAQIPARTPARSDAEREAAARARLDAEIAALRAEIVARGGQLIATAQAGDLFTAESGAGQVMVRHNASGLRCQFGADDKDKISVPAAGAPARAEEAACITVSGRIVSTVAFHKAAAAETPATAVAQAQAALTAQYPDARVRRAPAARPGGAVNTPAGVTVAKRWMESTGPDGARWFARAAGVVVDGWVVTATTAGPIQDLIEIDILGGEALETMLWFRSLDDAARARLDLTGVTLIAGDRALAKSIDQTRAASRAASAAALAAVGAKTPASRPVTLGASARVATPTLSSGMEDLTGVASRLVEAARLDAQALVDKAQAWDVFVIEKQAIIPIVRHVQSGLRCVFEYTEGAQLSVDETPGYARGDAVSCVMPERGQMTITRAAPNLSIDAAFQSAAAALTAQLPGAAPTPFKAGDRAERALPSGVPARTARYLARTRGGAVYARASVAIVDGFLVSHTAQAAQKDAATTEAAADAGFTAMITARAARLPDGSTDVIRAMAVLLGPAGSFDAADRDSDGVLTRAEWRRGPGLRFAVADADASFDRGDKNRDGGLDKKEFPVVAVGIPVTLPAVRGGQSSFGPSMMSCNGNKPGPYCP